MTLLKHATVTWTPSLYLAFCPSEIHTCPMGPIVEFAKSIFRHLVTMGGPGGTHSQFGMAADKFPFTLPCIYGATVTYSIRVWEHGSPEELQQGQRQVMWSHLPARQSRCILFKRLDGKGVGPSGEKILEHINVNTWLAEYYQLKQQTPCTFLIFVVPHK